jgi:uncharacterized protein involved in response to NO
MRWRILQEVSVAGKFPTVVRIPPEGGGPAGQQSWAIADIPSPVYSLPMKRTALLILLAGLLAVNIGVLTRSDTSTSPTGTWWISFLALMPFGLGLLVWRGFRWAAMVCVMYGTVGLAMDVATLVQILSNDPEVTLSLLNSLVSGCLNFLLILFGGRSFLDVR